MEPVPDPSLPPEVVGPGGVPVVEDAPLVGGRVIKSEGTEVEVTVRVKSVVTVARAPGYTAVVTVMVTILIEDVG